MAKIIVDYREDKNIIKGYFYIRVRAIQIL